MESTPFNSDRRHTGQHVGIATREPGQELLKRLRVRVYRWRLTLQIRRVNYAKRLLRREAARLAKLVSR